MIFKDERFTPGSVATSQQSETSIVMNESPEPLTTPGQKQQETETTIVLSPFKDEEEEKKKAEEAAKAAAAAQKSTDPEEPIYGVAVGKFLEKLNKAHEEYEKGPKNQDTYKKFTDISRKCYSFVKCENSDKPFVEITKDPDGKDLETPIKMPLTKDPNGASVPDLDPKKWQEHNPTYDKLSARRCGTDKNGKIVYDVAIEVEFEKEKCSKITIPWNATIRDKDGDLPAFTEWKNKPENKGKDAQSFLLDNPEIAQREDLTISAQGADGRIGDLCSAQRLGQLMKDIYPEMSQGQGHGVSGSLTTEQAAEQKIVTAPPSPQNQIVIDQDESVTQLTSNSQESQTSIVFSFAKKAENEVVIDPSTPKLTRSFSDGDLRLTSKTIPAFRKTASCSNLTKIAPSTSPDVAQTQTQGLGSAP
jgi:hypothetical protein